ncbi:MAG TPA: tripartite tricarboxylate transporter substrate binding protein [Xanthobacteraceae bacterium]|nr:tripartite tricarboxylate transporter substrate binding protein [Xanthobacteraceae bacterium]
MVRMTLARVLTGALIALAAILQGTPAHAADAWPSRPITVIVPFAGGSASDVVTRIMLAKMSQNMGQTIIVENRPGAGGNIGTAYGAKAAPDGYTWIASGSGPMAANVTLYRELGYDPVKDFEEVSPFAYFTIVIAASTKLPVKTLAELIAYAKAHPGELNYGSVGIGSSQHLGGVYFEQVTGTKLTHVPYKNIGQYGPDLIAGVVPLGFQWLPNVLAPINANGARALAVAGKERLPALPDTPTTIEAGLPDYQASGWFAMQVPHGTPKDIVLRINHEMAKALADPDVKKHFEQQGAVPNVLPPDEAAKFISSEIAKWHDIIVKANIPKID